MPRGIDEEQDTALCFSCRSNILCNPRIEFADWDKSRSGEPGRDGEKWVCSHLGNPRGGENCGESSAMADDRGGVGRQCLDAIEPNRGEGDQHQLITHEQLDVLVPTLLHLKHCCRTALRHKVEKPIHSPRRRDTRALKVCDEKKRGLDCDREEEDQ